MASSILCTNCRKWIHGRCAKIKRVTPRLANKFACAWCRKVLERVMEPVKKLCDEVATVNLFCYLDGKLNASGGCEIAVTARTRLRWMKFRECGEFLYGKNFSLKLKGRVYWTCVTSAMLYGSETGV